MAVIARNLGISESGLRRWVAWADVDEGKKKGVSSEGLVELVWLCRENRVLSTENEILKCAAACFVWGKVLLIQNNLYFLLHFSRQSASLGVVRFGRFGSSEEGSGKDDVYGWLDCG